MSNRFRMVLGLTAGILSSLLCFSAGAWLLFHAQANDGFDIGIGLYFLGKSVFVGPMLILSSTRAVENGSTMPLAPSQ
jgi:hypothetical protein